MGGPLPRSMLLAVVVLASALVALALHAAYDRLAAGGAPPVPVLLAGGLGFAALAALVTMLRGHFQALERLRADAVALAATGGEVPPRWHGDPSGGWTADPVGRMADTVARLVERERVVEAALEARLATVIAAADVGVVVLSPAGLVTLANGAARAMLGEGELRVGTSVFDAVHREELDEALALASGAAPVPVDGGAGASVPVSLRTVRGDVRLPARMAPLPDGQGTVLVLPEPAPAFRAALEQDLSLLDRCPRPQPLTEDMPLLALPVLVLDVETTGLDPTKDRVLSIGTVRMQGCRLFRAETLDILVDPGVAIPPRASAVHGITNAMVAGAPAFGEALPQLTRVLDGVVVVGHNIGFDLAVLEAEAARAGSGWARPPALDTLALAVALEPGRESYNLEELAETYGVRVTGRHTALGDCLVTAALFARMIALLVERGVADWGAVQRLAAAQTRVRRAQAAAGW